MLDVQDCCFFNKYQLKLADLPEELVDDIKVTFKIFDVDNGRSTVFTTVTVMFVI